MARGFYDLVTAITDHLEADQFVGTVSYGDIDDVDLEKRQIYSLAHFIIGTGIQSERAWTFTVSVICMDLVDESDAENEDLVLYNNNLQDVLNTQMFVIGQLIESLRRGTLYDNLFQLTGDPSVEPFTDRTNSLAAGWACDFTVLIPNDQFIC